MVCTVSTATCAMGAAGLKRTPADQSHAAALEELELVAFGAVAEALRTSGIQAQEVSACLVPNLTFFQQMCW